MPLVPESMIHLRNVLEVYKSKGKKYLFDAAGNSLKEKEIKDIYFYMTAGNIDVYRGGIGAWVLLDSYFKEKDDGFMSCHNTEQKLIQMKIECWFLRK